MFQSPKYKYLVQQRKVNFQSLKESGDIYKEFMGIDIKSVISNQEWESLAKSITRRHGLIHNSGLNRHFEEIIVESNEIEPLKALVIKFVGGVNSKLEEAGVL